MSQPAWTIGKPLTDDLEFGLALSTAEVHNAEREEVGDSFRQTGALRLREGGTVPRSTNQALGHAVGVLVGNNGEIESAVSLAVRVESQRECWTAAVRAWSHVRGAPNHAIVDSDLHRVALGAGGGGAASLEISLRFVESQQFVKVVQVVAKVEGVDDVLVVALFVGAHEQNIAARAGGPCWLASLFADRPRVAPVGLVAGAPVLRKLR